MFSMFQQTQHISSYKFSHCIELGLYLIIFVWDIICSLFVCFYAGHDVAITAIFCFCFVSMYVSFVILLCVDIFALILYFLGVVILYIHQMFYHFMCLLFFVLSYKFHLYIAFFLHSFIAYLVLFISFGSCYCFNCCCCYFFFCFLLNLNYFIVY